MKRGRAYQMQTPVKKWQEMSPMNDQLAIYQSDLSQEEQPSLFHSLVGNSPFLHSPHNSSNSFQEQLSDPQSSVSFSEPEYMQEEIPLSVSVMKVEESQSEIKVPLKIIDLNRKGCHCKNSKCQKNYCDCWRMGKVCDPNICACLDCHNKEEKEIHHKKLEKTTVQIKGCHCEKSKCLKKYCECHSAGRKCSELCLCIECHNQDENNKPQDRGEIAKRLRTGNEGQIKIY